MMIIYEGFSLNYERLRGGARVCTLAYRCITDVQQRIVAYVDKAKMHECNENRYVDQYMEACKNL